MKLYATVTSERASRPAVKGGDEYVHIEITENNKPTMAITVWPNTIQVLRLSSTRRDEKGKPVVTDSVTYHV